LQRGGSTTTIDVPIIDIGQSWTRSASFAGGQLTLSGEGCACSWSAVRGRIAGMMPECLALCRLLDTCVQRPAHAAPVLLPPSLSQGPAPFAHAVGLSESQ
jgi:hypothetical protein